MYSVSKFMKAKHCFFSRLFIYEVQHRHFPEHMTSVCTRGINSSLKEIDTALNLAVVYVVPLSIISFCLIHMSVTLCSLKSPRVVLSTQKNGENAKESVIALLVMFLLFGFGSFPTYALQVSADFTDDYVPLKDGVNRQSIAIIFSVVGNVLVPVINYVMNKSFKEGCQRLSCFKKHDYMAAYHDENSEDGNADEQKSTVVI